MSKELPLMLQRMKNQGKIENVKNIVKDFHYFKVKPNELKLRIVELQELQSFIEQALNQYSEHVLKEFEKGNKVPGYKPVAGRKMRKITDELSLYNYIEDSFPEIADDILVTKLKGIPAIEKMLLEKGYTKDEIAKSLEPFIEINQGKSTFKSE